MRCPNSRAFEQFPCRFPALPLCPASVYPSYTDVRKSDDVMRFKRFSNFPKMLQTMQSLDVGSQAQIRSALSIQIQDLNGQVARYSHALTTARDQYSLLHGQYQTLQGDAKKMTEEQKMQVKVHILVQSALMSNAELLWSLLRRFGVSKCPTNVKC